MTFFGWRISLERKTKRFPSAGALLFRSWTLGLSMTNSGLIREKARRTIAEAIRKDAYRK